MRVLKILLYLMIITSIISINTGVSFLQMKNKNKEQPQKTQEEKKPETKEEETETEQKTEQEKKEENNQNEQKKEEEKNKYISVEEGTQTNPVSYSNFSSSVNVKKVKDDPYNIYDTNEVYYADGKCNINNCENCISATKCQCPNGYAQDPKKEVKENELSCTYKRKKQYVFFLLELFLPIGIGHFYAGRIINGIVKLLVMAAIIALDIILKNKILKGFKTKQRFSIVSYILYFGILAWICIDIVCIGVNHYKDGKGISLYSEITEN